MKTTRKVLSIALVLAMVVAMFVVNASGAEATKLTNIGDQKSAQTIPSTATNIKYLSDTTPVSTSCEEKYLPAYTNDKPWAPAEQSADGVWIGIYGNPSQRYKVDKNNKDNNNEPGSRKLKVENKTEDTMVFWTDLRIGAYGWKYDKGLGVTPGKFGEADNVLVYAVGDATHFYAVVGNNDTVSSEPTSDCTVVYELWGCTSATDAGTKLAYAEIDDYYVAEFNVDVSAYSHIKLVTKLKAESKYDNNGLDNGLGGVWANACVYGKKATPTTGTTSGGSNNNDTPSKTADSFTMTAVAALVLGAASVTALVVSKKKFF